MQYLARNGTHSNNVIAQKFLADDEDKPESLQKNIKEYYVGANTLMQDRYHFWVKITQ